VCRVAAEARRDRTATGHLHPSWRFEGESGRQAAPPRGRGVSASAGALRCSFSWRSSVPRRAWSIASPGGGFCSRACRGKSSLSGFAQQVRPFIHPARQRHLFSIDSTRPRDTSLTPLATSVRFRRDLGRFFAFAFLCDRRRQARLAGDVLGRPGHQKGSRDRCCDGEPLGHALQLHRRVRVTDTFHERARRARPSPFQRRPPSFVRRPKRDANCFSTKFTHFTMHSDIERDIALLCALPMRRLVGTVQWQVGTFLLVQLSIPLSFFFHFPSAFARL